jgi:predicted membrane channel-forming protein YqfA (hemolysin III family)
MDERPQDDSHTVRPRWTWGALLVLLVGMVVIAVGNLKNSSVLQWVGVGLMVVGGLAALYGGFFYNVQGGSSLSAQLKDVKEGNRREFPGADTARSEEEVKRDVRRRWLHQEDES